MGEVLERIEGRFEKNSLFHRKCEKICKIKNSDYNYKNSLFHRICEFHYFSELLDNTSAVISSECEKSTTHHVVPLYEMFIPVFREGSPIYRGGDFYSLYT